MGLFNKKKEVAFEATKAFMVDMLQYDEKRKLIKIKGEKQPIAIEDITGYSLTFGNKTYTKANLGRAFIGGAAFGLAGIILAGTHQEEYVSNIKLTIIACGKPHFILLTLGKVKMNAAKGILDRAEAMVRFLDEVCNENEKSV